MKKLLRFVVSGCLIASWAAANAQVTYTATDISGETWQYDYTINNPLLVPASEFTIFFNQNQFSNLSVLASPASWSSIVAQPDPGLPADGFFDTLSLTTGLLPGASQSGFSVQTTYSGTGTPGSQIFNIVDSVTFAILSLGETTSASSGGGGGGGLMAPEIDPASAASALTLLMGSLAVLRGYRASGGRN
jgi:hypothetical protein